MSQKQNRLLSRVIKKLGIEKIGIAWGEGRFYRQYRLDKRFRERYLAADWMTKSKMVKEFRALLTKKEEK